VIDAIKFFGKTYKLSASTEIGSTALLPNIRLGWKWVATTQTIILNTSVSITAVKSFIVHACDKIQQVDQILKRMNTMIG
jgi:hypothetical protein